MVLCIVVFRGMATPEAGLLIPAQAIANPGSNRCPSGSPHSCIHTHGPPIQRYPFTAPYRVRLDALHAPLSVASSRSR